MCSKADPPPLYCGGGRYPVNCRVPSALLTRPELSSGFPGRVSETEGEGHRVHGQLMHSHLIG